MLVLSTAQMRAVDRHAIDDLGIPAVVLMENAGRGLAELVARERPRLADLRVAVVCGAGANGGDGFVAARHLAHRGARVGVFLARPAAEVKGDAAVFLAVLRAEGGVQVSDLSAATDGETWRAALEGTEVVVDALFGTGLSREPEGAPRAAVLAVNALAALTIAADLPSGLDADTGRVRGVAVRADVTGTMACRKLGLALDPEGPAGRVEIIDIGAPVVQAPALGPYCHWVDREMVFPRLHRRSPGAHKGDSGHLLIVAGSPGRTGAALLAARAAGRGGAGLVTVASTAAGQVALDAKLVEAMSARFTDAEDADAGSWDAIVRLSEDKRAVAVGPGLPSGPGTRALCRRLAAELALPVVLDAEALNHLGVDAGRILTGAAGPRILTPHPGEAARLLGTTAAQVQQDRLAAVRRLAATCRAVVVLKGARTLTAVPDGTVWINPAADPALATAGSGDVLTGLCGALLCQGEDPALAALAAVHIHGLAGEAAALALGGDTILAGDLPDAIATVMAHAR